MHLLVLSAFRLAGVAASLKNDLSQCTFWCSVLSDEIIDAVKLEMSPVSMHLLVLSAFRLEVIL